MMDRLGKKFYFIETRIPYVIMERFNNPYSDERFELYKENYLVNIPNDIESGGEISVVNNFLRKVLLDKFKHSVSDEEFLNIHKYYKVVYSRKDILFYGKVKDKESGLLVDINPFHKGFPKNRNDFKDNSVILEHPDTLPTFGFDWSAFRHIDANRIESKKLKEMISLEMGECHVLGISPYTIRIERFSVIYHNINHPFWSEYFTK